MGNARRILSEKQVESVEISINSIVDRLKQKLGLRKDKDLADRMGLKRPAVLYNWITRGTVPYEELLRFAVSEGLDFNWVLTGQKAGASIGASEPEAQYESKWDQAGHIHAVNEAVDQLCAELNILLPESVRRDVFDFAYLYKFDNTALRKLMKMIQVVAEVQARSGAD